MSNPTQRSIQGTWNATAAAFLGDISPDEVDWAMLIDSWKYMNAHVKITRQAMEDMLSTAQNTESLLKRWLEIYGKTVDPPPMDSS